MNKRKLWIWENENYPNFVYDEKEIDKIIVLSSWRKYYE